MYNRALSVEEISADYEASSIAGTVTYTRNETGIAGVTVNLTQDETLINSTVTDSGGNYAFTDIPPSSGDYNVTASKLLFWSNTSYSVTVTYSEYKKPHISQMRKMGRYTCCGRTASEQAI